MADIDYPKLTRQQRLAIFLICIGPEAAAEVLRHFHDQEIEAVCREMAGFPMIAEAVQRQALEEVSFTEMVTPFSRKILIMSG